MLPKFGFDSSPAEANKPKLFVVKLAKQICGRIENNLL